MRIKNFKRWVAGLCAATMLAGVPAMVGYAAQTKELTETYSSNTMEVKAEVVENDNKPSYAVLIPESVDFGRIQQPMTGEDSYAITTLTVSCNNATNLKAGQAIGVFVKASESASEKDPFKLANATGGELVYEMFDSTENNIQKGTYYPDGFRIAAFTSSGQDSVMSLRLNKAQLYDKDLATWGGQYTGTLNFTTRIASITDTQSMEGGQPVV